MNAFYMSNFFGFTQNNEKHFDFPLFVFLLDIDVLNLHDLLAMLLLFWFILQGGDTLLSSFTLEHLAIFLKEGGIWRQ